MKKHRTNNVKNAGKYQDSDLFQGQVRMNVMNSDYLVACVLGQIQMLNITGWKTKALDRGG
jgi:hypothetical protein